MLVGVYYNNHDVRLEERPVPRISTGEMLVKVIASGVCGSDVLEWYRIKKAPLVLGHEITGEIIEVGEGVEKYRGVLALPDEVSFEDGVFIEPLGCVVRAQRMSNLQPGQTVLVLGSGQAGLLHIALAKAYGAGRIIATDIADFRKEAAKRLGADVVLDGREDIPHLVREVNDGWLADQVIVCTGVYTAFMQALKAVERGGTVMTFATTEPDVDLPIPANEFWRNGITVKPSYGAAPNDLEIALRLIQFGRVPVRDMITHRLPLSEIAEGFQLAAEPRDSIKVVIRPHDE